MSAIAPTMYDGLSTRKKTCRIHDGNGTSRQMRSKIGFALKLIRGHILGRRTAHAPLFPSGAALVRCSALSPFVAEKRLEAESAVASIILELYVSTSHRAAFADAAPAAGARACLDRRPPRRDGLPTREHLASYEYALVL